MPRITAYTFEADIHCPDCASHRASVGLLVRTPPLRRTEDEHGLPLDLCDREGNPVRPVFSTDECAHSACGSCGAALA